MIRERNSAKATAFGWDAAKASALSLSLNKLFFYDMTMLGFLDDQPASAAAAPPREPVDETLLRAPEFSTDEFRIYKFKVRREKGKRRLREKLMLPPKRNTSRET